MFWNFTLIVLHCTVLPFEDVKYKGVSKSFETSSIDSQPMAVRE